MSVALEPTDLGFQHPFTVEVGQTLRIKNVDSLPIAFKVKTTAPKQYCVRPNSGRIEPGHDVEVSVLLQAMKQDPPLDQKCRDKFLVQSVAITADKEFNNVTQIWDSVEKSQVQEKKIRVSWLPPVNAPTDSASTPSRRTTVNGADATPDVAPPAYSSPGDGAQSPQQGDVTALTSHSEDEGKDIKTEDAKSEQPSLVRAQLTRENLRAASGEELKDVKAKLAKAEAKLAEMTGAEGLRQRKTGAAETSQPGSTTRQVQRQGTEGVPVQITALLCLLTFLLAYFFF